MYELTEELKQKYIEISNNLFTWTPPDYADYLEIIIE